MLFFNGLMYFYIKFTEVLPHIINCINPLTQTLKEKTALY